MTNEIERANEISFVDPWPWDRRFDKRKYQGNVVKDNSPMNLNLHERVRQLEKAGALIAAEIDRLLRKESNDE